MTARPVVQPLRESSRLWRSLAAALKTSTKPGREFGAARAVANFSLFQIRRRRVMLKRSVPHLFLVLFVFTTAQLARAQGELSDPGKSDKLKFVEQAQDSLPDLVRRVKPSVVSVLTYDAKGEPLISGSGFFVRPGEVVTNLHVVRGAHRVEIHTLEGKGRTYPVAGWLAIDEEGDLALLSVDLPPDRSRVLSLSSSLPEEGEKVFL